MPSNLKWNLSEDFISRTLNEITLPSVESTIKEEPLTKSRINFTEFRDRDKPLARARDNAFRFSAGDSTFGLSGRDSGIGLLATLRERDEPLARARDSYIGLLATLRERNEPLVRARDSGIGHLDVLKERNEPLARNRAIGRSSAIQFHRS